VGKNAASALVADKKLEEHEKSNDPAAVAVVVGNGKAAPAAVDDGDDEGVPPDDKKEVEVAQRHRCRRLRALLAYPSDCPSWGLVSCSVNKRNCSEALGRDLSELWLLLLLFNTYGSILCVVPS
jgi:hypothetical protein